MKHNVSVDFSIYVARNEMETSRGKILAKQSTCNKNKKSKDCKLIAEVARCLFEGVEEKCEGQE